MRVLVTGGAGYIGSHAARRLRSHGHEVVIYDNLSTGHLFLADGFELVVGDIGDLAKLSAVLKKSDAVLHFAGSTCVSESVTNPRKYFENNLLRSLSLLQAAVDAGIRHFVFSSTCAVYGLPEKMPIDERAPRNPVNPYGATKLSFELALEAYGKAYGPTYAALRYFNAAGADESGEIGELHEPEMHLIPRVLETAAGIREQVDVYGTDYPTPDGSCVRDYVHVNDLADAHVLALEYLARGGTSDAFNLGSGTGYSVLDVLAAIEDITGLKVARSYRPRRSGDPPVLIADSRHAAQQLGWNPSRSLTEIVATAWRWMRREAKVQTHLPAR